MKLEYLLEDKSIKAKTKVAQMGEWLLKKQLSTENWLAFASVQNATNKATCIEAMEYATKMDAGIADKAIFQFVINALQDEAPRIKWESAKVIGHIAPLFPQYAQAAIKHLLANVHHPGNVVRWATAGALYKIIFCNSKLQLQLHPIIEKLVEDEKDNAVKKIYLSALKK